MRVSVDVPLCESEIAQFKGLIMPAIRAVLLKHSLSHHLVNIHMQREREEDRWRELKRKER